MEEKKSSFVEECEKYLKSEDCQDLYNLSLKNKKGEKVEHTLEEFRTGSKLFADWLVNTYDVRNRK